MRAIGAYATVADPLGDVASRVALVVASNQPFYPLYLHGIAGSAAWPAWLTLATTPFFALVPAAARRHGLTGRVLMVLTGIVNTVFCVKLFGARSGVELFLLPCTLLAALLFRPHERRLSLLLLGLPFLAYLVLDPRLGAPVMQVPDEVYPTLVAINATSVGALTALIGLLVAGRLAPQPAIDAADAQR